MRRLTPLANRLLAAAVHAWPFSPGRRFARAVGPLDEIDTVRLGTDYGGWTIAEHVLGPESVCYCAGVGDDISFDLALIERYGCDVHAFDPTPASIRHVERTAADQPAFKFHPWAVWSTDGTLRLWAPDYGDANFSAGNRHSSDESFDAPCRSLPSLMAELGHTHLDLLKIDVEGAEYELIETIIGLEPSVSIFCVEFHKEPGIERMTSCVARLRQAGYRPIALDGYDVSFVSSRAGRTA
ncbi:MAG: FkbM family methyltransferase [Vicinamibacteria bacterium]